MMSLSPRQEILNQELIRKHSSETGLRSSEHLWLDKNENTDPVFLDFLKDLTKNSAGLDLTLYPDLGPLYQKLAGYENLKAAELLLTAGSDAGIRTVFETFVSRGDRVLIPAPTFAMYPVYAKIFGAQLTVEVYEKGPRLNLESLCRKIQEQKPKLLCLPNPDSPTGTVIAEVDLRKILELCLKNSVWVLIDEAYVPFYPLTTKSWIHEFPNLIVARTFSKAWGLAGLRLGYVISSERNIDWLTKVRPMYEIGATSAWMMSKLLDHSSEMMKSVQRLNAGRDWAQSFAKQKKWSSFQSYGNFFHLNFGDRHLLALEKLKKKILFRESFVDECLKPYCRISAAPTETLEPLFKELEGF
jgi:histidinol-phosphate aminotransferase